MRREVDVGRERDARHVSEIGGRAHLRCPCRAAAAVAELRLRCGEQSLRGERMRVRHLFLLRGVTVPIAPALYHAVRGELPLGAARVPQLDAHATFLRRLGAALPPRRLVLVLRPRPLAAGSLDVDAQHREAVAVHAPTRLRTVHVRVRIFCSVQRHLALYRSTVLP